MVRLRTQTTEKTYNWLNKNAPLPTETSDSALLTYWLQYAIKQHMLEEARATGKLPAESVEEYISVGLEELVDQEDDLDDE